MSKSLLKIVGFALLGLLAGYVFFGKWGGDYLSMKTLFSFGGNAFESAFQSISGIEEIRYKILICGAVGAAVGAFLAIRK